MGEEGARAAKREIPPDCYLSRAVPGFEGQERLVCGDGSDGGSSEAFEPFDTLQGEGESTPATQYQIARAAENDDPFRRSPGVPIDYNLFCRGVRVLAQENPVMRYPAKAAGYTMAAGAALDDAIIDGGVHGFVIDPLAEAVGVELPTDDSVGGKTIDWGLRTAGAAGAYALYDWRRGANLAMQEAARKGVKAPTAAQRWKGAAGKYGPFFGMLYLIDTKLASSPDHVLDVAGGGDLKGWEHDLAYYGVLGTGTAGALSFIKHEYSQSVSAGGAKVSPAAGWGWMGFWFAYSMYWRMATDEGRALSALDGEEQSAGLNPLNWKWDYVNPDTAASNYFSWAVSAPAWGALGGVSRWTTDRIWRLGGGEAGAFNKVITFNPEELAAVDAAAPTVLGRKLPFASREFLSRALRRDRVAYSAIMYANGLLIGMFAANAMQQVRDYRDPSTLQGSSIRTVFTSGANAPVTHALKNLGADVNAWQYYMAGMLFLYPYESCNESNESLSTIARFQANQYEASENPAERRRIAGLVYRLGLSSLPGTTEKGKYTKGERDHILEELAMNPELDHEVREIGGLVEASLTARGVDLDHDFDPRRYHEAIEEAVAGACLVETG